MIDWAYCYYKELKKFGIHDDAVENGYISLCNAYARKTHSKLLPLIISVLRNEKNKDAVESSHDNCLHT